MFSVEQRLVRIDLASGGRRIVSGDGVGTGPPLQDCIGMAIDPTGQTIRYEGRVRSVAAIQLDWGRPPLPLFPRLPELLDAIPAGETIRVGVMIRTGVGDTPTNNGRRHEIANLEVELIEDR